MNNQTDISGIAPFFIVKNVPAALSFYRDRLGCDIVRAGNAANVRGPRRFMYPARKTIISRLALQAPDATVRPTGKSSLRFTQKLSS